MFKYLLGYQVVVMLGSMGHVYIMSKVFTPTFTLWEHVESFHAEKKNWRNLKTIL